jgi:hypothetical protein
MTITITRPGQKDRTSKNLRGIYTQSREAAVEYVVAIDHYERGGTVKIHWHGGAHCRTEFADYTVLCDWLRKARMFRGVDIKYKKGN